MQISPLKMRMRKVSMTNFRVSRILIKNSKSMNVNAIKCKQATKKNLLTTKLVNYDSFIHFITRLHRSCAVGRGKETRPDTRPSVADGWAGAEMRVFPLFNSITTDQPTNKRTDGQSLL